MLFKFLCFYLNVACLEQYINYCFHVSSGATVSQPRDKSITPLHLAANSGDVSIVKLLVEKRARIDALDADQSTPLHKCAARNNFEAVRYLVTRFVLIDFCIYMYCIPPTAFV